MLSFHQLSININGRRLFNNLTVTFLPSSITYLQGINGSGKTSLLRASAGIIAPASGSINYKPQSNANKTYIGHNLGLKQELTVLENLKFWSEIYNSTEALEASIHYFQLDSLLNKKIYQLSAGNQKKVALSRLLSCQSDLWLLDEAEVSLDAENKKLLHNLIISKANNGGIILLTTHGETDIKGAQVLCLEDFNDVPA